MSKRKIAVLSEGRQDYGIYLPVLKAIQASPDLELNLIVTGMHLLKEHGETYKEIMADGFDPLISTGDWCPFSVSIKSSDWLVVLGDRMPMLKAVISAAELGIPIAHIQGGDVTTGACIDESIRHAISRFAHLHFPSMKSSAKRLWYWGEDDWRIKVVGPLGIYNLQSDIPEYKRHFNEPIVLVIQHPVRPESAYEEMMQTLNACGDSEISCDPIVIYPNNDNGGNKMITAINDYGCFTTYRNLPFLQFQSLLKASSVLVGNSSVALHEAPFYGVPVVEIGDREQSREHWGKFISVPHDSEKIKQAIEMCLKEGRYKPIRKNVIDGPGIIVKALAETPIDEKLRRKGYV